MKPHRDRSSLGCVELIPPFLRASAIPLTVVTGPPGAGKSTLVKTRRGSNDIVIDLDEITDKVKALGWVNDRDYLSGALAVRNRMLTDLAADEEHEHAWFVICAADPSERALWARLLGGELIVLTTPLATCLERIAADAVRSDDAEGRAKAARKWWDANALLRDFDQPTAVREEHAVGASVDEADDGRPADALHSAGAR